MRQGAIRQRRESGRDEGGIEYLIGLGHRRRSGSSAGGPTRGWAPAPRRLHRGDGCGGLSVDTRWSSAVTSGGARLAAAQELLARGPPTAIFATSDAAAFGVLGAAGEPASRARATSRSWASMTSSSRAGRRRPLDRAPAAAGDGAGRRAAPARSARRPLVAPGPVVIETELVMRHTTPPHAATVPTAEPCVAER